MPPVIFGTVIPIIAFSTLFVSVDFALVTALAHMLNPITVASIGSFVTRFLSLINFCQLLMNFSFSLPSADIK